MDAGRNPWDERYAGERYFYGEAPNDWLRDHAGLLPPGARVVCLAEGEGRNGVFLATRGFDVVGVDGSRVGLEKARALAARQGVRLGTVVADLRTHDLGEGAWGGVVSIWCHMAPQDRGPLHARIRRGLAPGGVVLFEHYHPAQVGRGTGGPPDPAMMLTLDELRRDFAGFEVLHAFEGERDVREGQGHTGLSSVTQFAARKPA
jgi:SAM-dependent methyltransferase